MKTVVSISQPAEVTDSTQFQLVGSVRHKHMDIACWKPLQLRIDPM